MKTSIPKLHSIRLKGSDKVVPISPFIAMNLEPNQVIAEAFNAKMREVIIIGYDNEGAEYFASSKADGPSVLWLLARFKMLLLKSV